MSDIVRNELALLTRTQLDHEAVIRKAVDHIDLLRSELTAVKEQNEKLVEALKWNNATLKDFAEDRFRFDFNQRNIFLKMVRLNEKDLAQHEKEKDDAPQT